MTITDTRSKRALAALDRLEKATDGFAIVVAIDELKCILQEPAPVRPTSSIDTPIEGYSFCMACYQPRQRFVASNGDICCRHCSRIMHAGVDHAAKHITDVCRALNTRV